MTRRRKKSSGSYEVGYGKPPAEHRFKKGQRRRKGDLEAIDITDVLTKPVLAKVNGEMKDLHPYEAILRQMLARALKEGQVRSLIGLIRIFEEHGVYAPQPGKQAGGVLVVGRAPEPRSGQGEGHELGI